MNQYRPRPFGMGRQKTETSHFSDWAHPPFKTPKGQDLLFNAAHSQLPILKPRLFFPHLSCCF